MDDYYYRPRGFIFLPVVVKNLLIINGLCFLASFVLAHSFNIDLNKIFGIYYPESENFKFYQIVTYMFMHGSFTHLFFNMFALWMFGYLLENVWGSKKFLIYYFITGIGAIAIQMLVNFFQYFPISQAIDLFRQSPNPEDFEFILVKYFKDYFDRLDIQQFINRFSLLPENPENKSYSVYILENLYKLKLDIPTVGASGAVFGILLAFGLMFPNHLIYIYFLFPIKAKWFVIIYGIIELWAGLANRPGDNIAHFAHLGGMLFGFILIKLWRKKSNYFDYYYE